MMAKCAKCGRSDKVMRCICEECLAELTAAPIHPAEELPPLFTQCEPVDPDNPDEGFLTFRVSDPVLCWCPDREEPRVVGVYIEGPGDFKGWEIADYTGEQLDPTHWFALPAHWFELLNKHEQ